MTALTTKEQTELVRLETTIKRGISTFVETGTALQEIRDKKLYRDEYDTFEEYCHGKWNFTYRRAHQLIESASAATNVARKSLPPIPTERAAREIARAPKEKQAEAWKKSVESGDTSSEAIRKNVKKLAPPPTERVLPKDERGVEIPADLVALWLRRGELGALAKQVSEVKCAIEKAQEAHDPLFKAVNFSSVIANLQQAYAELTAGKPQYVCPMCQGTGCKPCNGMGIMGKFAFDHKVPAEFKQ